MSSSSKASYSATRHGRQRDLPSSARKTENETEKLATACPQKMQIDYTSTISPKLQTVGHASDKALLAGTSGGVLLLKLCLQEAGCAGCA
eukprot:CAMPEP_0170615648 /NCGR_PEP_ID=MMETSP0224-20130122/25451_1 /TAXON_ID=285029 /ORGANISM="Togula jolla, Strain CCCM 725" /LENGTH=89 /DNA_ID=CAMNT_0010941397 /DNA_START=8 /DNA_END=274 /DNA_ORIENTATION=+